MARNREHKAFLVGVELYLLEKTDSLDEDLKKSMDDNCPGWRENVETELRIRNGVQREMFVEYFRRNPELCKKNLENFVDFTKIKNTPMYELLEEMSNHEGGC